jgi:thiol-disulfide isomerase/thioredoxin
LQLRALAFVALLVLAGCQPAEAPDEWTGAYRATLQVPGGELPFGLELTRSGNDTVAWLVNGVERVRINEVTIKGNEITLRMPGFENRIVARREAQVLRGSLHMVKAKHKDQQIPFTAVRSATARFFDGDTPADIQVAGRWAATFTDDKGASYVAVGEFVQQGSDVAGTFLTPTGDYRYLKGQVREGKLYLATFNGGHVFLFHAALGTDGVLNGEYWSGLASHERFTAHRDDKAALGNATAVTAMRKVEPLLFSFPDLGGKPVSLRDERFRGKVVVVTLAGSWCPNCHDEAVYLQPYYLQHQSEGLEVVGLMFEQFDTTPEARDAVQRFRDRYAITYPLLLAGITDRDDAATRLPQLNGVYAYPTTIFVDRKGLVRHIHTGFSGPATGEHFTALTQDFDNRVRALLAE